MAKTRFWICGDCGYHNRPHPYRKDNTACEQCGSSQADDQGVEKPEHVDIAPTSSRVS